jgi:hypothetical protein
MSKWKTVMLRLPREIDAVVDEIARRSGDSRESVVRVILTMQLMRVQAQFTRKQFEAARKKK